MCNRVAWRRVGLPLLLLLLSGCGGANQAPVNEWRGWWKILHRNTQGELVPDKFTQFLVIEDRMGPEQDWEITGQWSGCVWLPVSRIDYAGQSVSLTFEPPGDAYTFRMTRTGVDEADGVYLDAPDTHYVAKRQGAGECEYYLEP
jgi:hypothetical protein